MSDSQAAWDAADEWAERVLEAEHRSVTLPHVRSVVAVLDAIAGCDKDNDE